MTKREYQVKYDEAEKVVAKAQKISSAIAENYAREHCPHKIRDVATVHGYSHEGKKCLIEGIGGAENFCGKLVWRVHGTVLKKNGEKSSYCAVWKEDQVVTQKKAPRAPIGDWL